jgi:peptidyl-prolyl cis-trans isomerase SurA
MDSAMPDFGLKFSSFRAGLAALALAAAGIAPAPAVAQVVVVANGSPITVYDIEQRTKLMATSTHKAPTRQEVIQELIDDRLKIAKAKSYGFEIGDTEVEQAYDNMARAQHVTTAQFSQMIERSGITPSSIKARIRAELTWSQLVRGKFSSSLQVGDSDINNALRSRNESDADAVGYIYTLYPIMVLVPQGSPPATIEAKKREAENLRGRFVSCKDGLPFARALRDVAVREPLTRGSGDLPEQLRAVLADTPVGHLTAPDVTGQGLQMFALCDKKESKTDSALKRETRQQLFAKRYDAEAKKYLDEIRKQAMIVYKEKK